MVAEGGAAIRVDLKFVLASGILKEKTERGSQVMKNKTDAPLIHYFQILPKNFQLSNLRYRKIYSSMQLIHSPYSGTHVSAGTPASVPNFPLLWCRKKEYMSSEDAGSFL